MQGSADRRVDAVGANHEIPLDRRSVGEVQARDAVVLIETGRVRVERDRF